MEISDQEYELYHYGIKRRSGRYPWGSGEGLSDAEVNDLFLNEVEKLRKSGLTDTQIAGVFEMKTTELRSARSLALRSRKQDRINQVTYLRYTKGYSTPAIAKRTGIPEPTVRKYLEPATQHRLDLQQSVANTLKQQVKEKGFLDVGTGVERHMNINANQLSNGVNQLKAEGYDLHYVKIPQLGTKNQTTLKVLVPPGTEYRDTFANRFNIKMPFTYSSDGGKTFDAIQPPLNISSKRVGIRYAEEGGADADGVIYVRRGVDDVSLGGAGYAQVRIAVDGSHYIKGMAVYRDNLPNGVDLVFNTNKSNTGNKLDALKKQDLSDPTNPFGAAISRQIGVKTVGNNKKLTSVMNIVNEEGKWGEWSKTLSKQVLSKQSVPLARELLGRAAQRQKDEFASIMKLTNPSVRRKRLEQFSDGADSAAVHMKAASLPRQATHVILPINSLKDNEVYAPNYENGERVVLIRFPHGSKSEIPDLIVNNRNREGIATLGRHPRDAIGINARVAERMSGADFDGDTVLVIPNAAGKIKTAPPLEGLKGFDPKERYPGYEGMEVMTSQGTGLEMGKVSNLLADMQLRGATDVEVAAALRHSMVVIDAEKHKLNYKASARDNGIAALEKKYQSNYNDSGRPGASTLISRGSAKKKIDEVKLRPQSQGGPIDPITGKKVWVATGRKWTNEKGEEVTAKSTVTKLDQVDDAHKLSSGTLMETVYAEHSNLMRSLANEARREMLKVEKTPYSENAAKVYSREVEELASSLNLALRNAPIERAAQVLGNAHYRMKKQANPNMSNEEKTKAKNKSLLAARLSLGAEKDRIKLTERQWEAIQAGAIRPSVLEKILNHADPDQIKALSTPKEKAPVTASQLSRAKKLMANGGTAAEVANLLGISTSTLNKALYGGEG